MRAALHLLGGRPRITMAHQKVLIDENSGPRRKHRRDAECQTPFEGGKEIIR